MRVADHCGDIVEWYPAQFFVGVANDQKASIHREAAAFLRNLDNAAEHGVSVSGLEAGIANESEFGDEDAACLLLF